MRRVFTFLAFSLAILQISYAAVGDVKILLGPSQIAQNQAFTIKIVVENEHIKSYSDFPEIEGFQKRGTSSSTNTSFVNGKMSVQTSITQNYVASAQGTFTLNAFSMKVNAKVVKSDGKRITVTEAAQRQRRRDPFAWDPFDEFFGGGRSEVEYVDVEADAFFAVTTDRNEVYKGQGFNLTVSFFVSDRNKAQMRFPGDIGQQVAEIVKKIKPDNVWEENFGISEIVRTPIKLGGKNYDQYILFQATYFPLNEDDITIPSSNLKMIKYKEAKRRSFFGTPRQEDEALFTSKQKVIKVKPLPEHPLKETVSVGNYRLEEFLDGKELETGKSFEYTFRVMGEGNISGIPQIGVESNEDFDFYPPNIAQNIERSGNRVRGSKTFNFYAIPKEPGEYNLADYFSFVFFDPIAEKYDTLSSELAINITGESKKNSYILSNDMGSFYDVMEFANNKLRPVKESALPKMLYLIGVSLALIVGLFYFFKK